MNNENSSGFNNFSQIGKECPRCGEENDKCGIFEDANFVMCRTDVGDSVEPRTDVNGWEYWPYQIGEGDKYHEVYSLFCESLSLSTEDEQALLARGLDRETIIKNNYKTIHHRSGNDGLHQIIELLDSKFTLTGIPGFYLKNGKRDINAQYKQMLIPVRNFSGRITQFILRNNSVNDKQRSKYTMFSSNNKDEGAKIQPQIHFPLGNERCGHEVRIVEGILKADVATALGNIYCIGLHGLASKGLLPAIEMLGVSKVRLCIDIDWQSNHHVLNGLRRLYRIIANAGFEIAIEEWNASDGKGIDDILLVNGHIWQMPNEELEFILECPNFDRNDWIYINKTSQFANVSCLPIELFDEKHFNNHFVKFKEELAKEAKSMVRQCHSLTYLPLEDQIVLQDNFFNLNIWQNTGIAADKGDGDLTVFHEHCAYIFPDNEQRSMFLDWMANIIQHRGKKFSYAMLLHGEEGTGKTWLIHCLSLILGKSNVQSISNRYIHGNFNSLFEGKELLIVNEVMAGGRRDFMNLMKDYIDDKEILINKKGIPEYKMPFLANWFMTTNYDDALLIDDKDRRYLILSSPANCGNEVEATERGARLFQWSGGGKENYPIQVENISALHRWLLNRVVKISPFAKAPVTAAKAHMQEESLTVFEKFVKERVEEEMWPFNADLVCIEHIKLFPAIERRFEKISPHKWAKTLRKFGALPYGTQLNDNGEILEYKRLKVRLQSENSKQRYIWMLRRTHMYANLTPREIEELYLMKKPTSDEPHFYPPNGYDEPL